MHIYTKAFIITTVVTAPFVGWAYYAFVDYFVVGYYIGIVVATINFFLAEYLKKNKKEKKDE